MAHLETLGVEEALREGRGTLHCSVQQVPMLELSRKTGQREQQPLSEPPAQSQPPALGFFFPWEDDAKDWDLTLLVIPFPKCPHCRHCFSRPFKHQVHFKMNLIMSSSRAGEKPFSSSSLFNVSLCIRSHSTSGAGGSFSLTVYLAFQTGTWQGRILRYFRG